MAGLLSKVALLCSVLGLVALFFVSTNITGNVTKIGEVTAEQDGMAVKVCGNVISKFTSKSGHTFMKVLDDSASISVVVFNTSAVKDSIVGVKVNQSVCITGLVEVYEGDVEILPKVIEKTA